MNAPLPVMVVVVVASLVPLVSDHVAAERAGAGADEGARLGVGPAAAEDQREHEGEGDARKDAATSRLLHDSLQVRGASCAVRWRNGQFAQRLPAKLSGGRSSRTA